MNNEYPKMMYAAGGDEEIHGGKFATVTVHSADEEDEARDKGWHLTTTDATKADAGGGTGGAADDNAPPTRDELKAKAAELGLTYPGNISNDKLAALVAEALEKA